jgi:peptidoglycan biosynthesis protein MviN/MurJ (putative lipid II flippase)
MSTQATAPAVEGPDSLRNDGATGPIGLAHSAITARKARAGMAMSLATFAMAAASAVQAVLFLSRFGTNTRTDGFFVAFAVYSTFGVFCQSMRLTSVPMLVEPQARLSGREYAAALGFVALPVLVVTIPLAGPLSHLIAPGLGAQGRAVTAAALPVLGCAMTLQLWAAGGAAMLAIRDRFTTIAGAYMSGACAGLVTFLALMDRAGVQTLGWSMLAMSVVTSAWMLLGMRRSGGLGARRGSLALKSIVRDAALVLGRTAVYLAFNMLFVITLAFASHSAAGGTTVLSYAYLFASYLVAGTGMALGQSSIPDMTREARARRRAVVTETVPRGFRYAMLIVAPALAALIAAGAPLIHALFPASLTSAGAHTLRTFSALLVAWTVAALLVNFLLPALFAVGRTRLLNALVLPLVVLHLTATAVGSLLFGVDGAVGAFFLAPTCLGAILLIAGAGAGPASASVARQLASDGARFLALAAVAFGAGWSLGTAAPTGLAQAAVAIVVGSALYAAGLALFARRQLQVVFRAVRTRPAAAA